METKKALRLGIWVSTGLFSAMLAFSGLLFLVGPAEVTAQLRHLGYPDYFRVALGIAKLLGVVALVVPLPSPTPREWAYAGFAFDLVFAVISHASSGDPPDKLGGALFALALLATSYSLRRRAARFEPATA
jgi:MYXO-CTERM domain-containing protein